MHLAGLDHKQMHILLTALPCIHVMAVAASNGHDSELLLLAVLAVQQQPALRSSQGLPSAALSTRCCRAALQLAVAMLLNIDA
jgi:hypothetical protein